jgi:hypothetical protein
MDSNKSVVHIEHSVEPCSNQFIFPTYQPNENALYVLETVAGFSERHGIAEGMQADFSLEGEQPEYVQREDLGIRGINVTSGIAREMHLDEVRGVLVTSVVGGSPAERAGMRGATEIMQIDGESIPVGGDVIIAVDGIAIRNNVDAAAILGQKMIGDNARFTVIRNGNMLDVNIMITLDVAFRHELTAATGDSGVMLTVQIMNPYAIGQPYVAVIEVRDMQGYTMFLTWNTGTLHPGDQIDTSVIWMPDGSGVYAVRAFVVTDAESPRALTPVTQIEVMV